MRASISLLLLSFSLSLHAADLPPLAENSPAWAASVGHGAVATAEKRDGRWAFAIAGQPFAAEHAAVPPEHVIFEIGSISKVFTGILLADAVADGKLSLDDSLAKRLPVKFAEPATGAITLRQLATHTSCLPRMPDNLTDLKAPDPYASYDNKALFEYLERAKLAKSPPCVVENSHLGFGTLGVVLETAYGKPWNTLVQEKIAGPLGMTDTAQELSANQRSRFATPWNGAEPGHPSTFKALAGAGSLRSSLADMSKLADALLAGVKGPLAKAWPLLAGDFAEMPGMATKIGLALIHDKVDGEDGYWHNGGTGGYRSLLVVWPASGRAAIFLTSNGAAAPEGWLGDWASGRQFEQRAEVALPPAASDEYVGVYSIDTKARLTVLRRGEALVVRVTDQPFFPIFASAKDEFFYKVVDARISFHRDAAGKITGLTLHQKDRDIAATRDTGPAPHIEFPTADALAEYVGEYVFGQLQTGPKITVTHVGDQLFAVLTAQTLIPVFSVGKDRFEFDVDVASLTFERDAAGTVTAVVLHKNGQDLRASRK